MVTRSHYNPIRLLPFFHPRRIPTIMAYQLEVVLTSSHPIEKKSENSWPEGQFMCVLSHRKIYFADLSGIPQRFMSRFDPRYN